MTNEMFEPYIHGVMPIDGECFFIVQFSKYECDEDDKELLESTLRGCVTDSDATRPMFAGTADVAVVDELIEALDQKLLCYAVETPTTCYANAKSRIAWDFFIGWAQYLSKETEK